MDGLNDSEKRISVLYVRPAERDERSRVAEALLHALPAGRRSCEGYPLAGWARLPMACRVLFGNRDYLVW